MAPQCYGIYIFCSWSASSAGRFPFDQLRSFFLHGLSVYYGFRVGPSHPVTLERVLRTVSDHPCVEHCFLGLLHSLRSEREYANVDRFSVDHGSLWLCAVDAGEAILLI